MRRHSYVASILSRCSFDPRPDFAGEKFNRPGDKFLREIAEEARRQLQTPETEFSVKGSEALRHGLGTADNRDLAQPALGFVLVFGQDFPPQLIAAASVSGRQPFSSGPRGLAGVLR
jgi:hypothetical protein